MVGNGGSGPGEPAFRAVVHNHARRGEPPWRREAMARAFIEHHPIRTNRTFAEAAGAPVASRERLGKRLGFLPDASGRGPSKAGAMIKSAVDGRRAVSAAYEVFREAVLDLTNEPTAPNVARYLSASRALDLPAPRDWPGERSGHASQRRAGKS